MENTIFTIGHSNRAFSEFLQKLKENQIEVLIDVRSHPYSRFCPQFNLKRLSDALNMENITYIFKGNNLGGKGENIDYEETIDKLVILVKDKKNICVMCSECNYRKCHRFSVLTPSFESRGIIVKHIE